LEPYQFTPPFCSKNNPIQSHLQEENERLRGLQRRPRSAQGERAPAADPAGQQQPAPLSERGAAQVCRERLLY